MFFKKALSLAITVTYMIKQFIGSKLLKSCLKNKVETLTKCALT